MESTNPRRESMTSDVNDSPTGNISTTKSIHPHSPNTEERGREVEVALQLGSFIRFADGRIELGEGRLFRNIEGLPLPLHRVTTLEDLIRAQHPFFPTTYVAHGLDPNHISVWYILLRPGDENARTLGPLTNDQEWRAEVKTLFETVNKPCKAHKLPKCALCQAPPIIIACFDDMHLKNGLATHGLASGTKIDFLDHRSAAMDDMYMSASDTLRQSLANLQREVRGKPFRDLATPYSLPAYNGNEYIGLFVLSAPGSLGLVPGATLTASAQITLPSRGPVAAQVQHFSAQVGRRKGVSVLEFSRTQATTLLLRLNRAAVHQTGSGAAPIQPYGVMPQAGNGDTNSNGKRPSAQSTSDNQTKTSPTEKPTKKPRQKPVVSPRNWDEATVRPQNWPEGKDENDTCLICIHMARNCSGTELDNQGRCMKCTKQPGQGGRKCYWKNPALGIRTYADAKKADPNARYLWQNTRASKAERAQKKATQQVQRAPTVSGASAAGDQVMKEVEVLDLDVEDGQKHQVVNGNHTNEGGELRSRNVSVEELLNEGDESEGDESGSESASDMDLTGVTSEAAKDEEMKDDIAGP